jgi:hypothetical protein
MKRLLSASTLIALIAAAAICRLPPAVASSCRENCLSDCSPHSRCTKEKKEARCYRIVV